MKNQHAKIDYHSMEPSKKKKKRQLLKKKKKLKSTDQWIVQKKQEVINNMQQRKKKSCLKDKSEDIASCIQQFKKNLKEGPYHICYVCNRDWYKKSVLKLITSNYPHQHIFTKQESYDEEYICKTCHSKMIRGKVPCQAVVNNLDIDDIPTELNSLKKLQQI